MTRSSACTCPHGDHNEPRTNHDSFCPSLPPITHEDTLLQNLCDLEALEAIESDAYVTKGTANGEGVVVHMVVGTSGQDDYALTVREALILAYRLIMAVQVQA